jgi:hypothetical protein
VNKPQNGRKLKNDKLRDTNENCSQYVLRLLKELNRAITYRDLGLAYAYGTYRNTTSKLVKKGEILKLPKENPARFILPEWVHRPEYFSVLRNDNRGKVGKFDFSSFLESLPWSHDLTIHNLKLTFEVYNLRWVRENWLYCSKSHSYRRDLRLSYPVKVQCYDTGTVLVNIESSVKPFKLDDSGIMALLSLLGEVRNSLNSEIIPEPLTWTIVQWHFNRDTEILEGSGLDFCITFSDFFKSVARVYYKHTLDKVRAEVIQSPDKTVKQLFEEILNRDAILRNSRRGEPLDG